LFLWLRLSRANSIDDASSGEDGEVGDVDDNDERMYTMGRDVDRRYDP
jgi:hypothetical protein